MRVALIALMGLLAASAAQAGSKSATSTWFGGYGPPTTDERAINLSTAITNRSAQMGTLGLPGNNYVTNNNQTNIGTQIDVDNGSGNVDLDAEQNNNIGSQGNAASSTSNAGDGDFSTSNIIDLD